VDNATDVIMRIIDSKYYGKMVDSSSGARHLLWKVFEEIQDDPSLTHILLKHDDVSAEFTRLTKYCNEQRQREQVSAKFLKFLSTLSDEEKEIASELRVEDFDVESAGPF
jgi:hypothetical protein